MDAIEGGEALRDDKGRLCRVVTLRRFLMTKTRVKYSVNPVQLQVAEARKKVWAFTVDILQSRQLSAQFCCDCLGVWGRVASGRTWSPGQR